MTIDAFRDQDTFFSDTTKEKLDQMSTVDGHTKGLKEANWAKIWRKTPISEEFSPLFQKDNHKKRVNDIGMCASDDTNAKLYQISTIQSFSHYKKNELICRTRTENMSHFEFSVYFRKV